MVGHLSVAKGMRADHRTAGPARSVAAARAGRRRHLAQFLAGSGERRRAPVPRELPAKNALGLRQPGRVAKARVPIPPQPLGCRCAYPEHARPSLAVFGPTLAPHAEKSRTLPAIEGLQRVLATLKGLAQQQFRHRSTIILSRPPLWAKRGACALA